MSRYIDADLIEDALIEHGQHDKQFKLGEIIKYRPFDVQGIIDKEVSTADVRENVKGEWQITDAYPHNVYCSVCHKKFAQTHWAVWEDGSLPRNYCPNCGADMRGEA